MRRPFDPITIPLGGISLIEASAGTGKTYSIATLYLRLLLEKRLTVGQILVVTFTEAATSELHDRIRSRLRDACHAFEKGTAIQEDDVLFRIYAKSSDRRADLLHLRQALADLDEAPVSTIHGFCNRMLRESAFESGMPFDMELLKEIDDLLRETVEDYVSLTGHDEDIRLVALYRTSYSVDTLMPLARLVLRHREYTLVPTIPSEQETARELEACNVLYRKAAERWAAERTKIEQELQPSKRLLKKAVDLLAGGLIEHWQEYFEKSVPPSLSPPKGSELFIPGVFCDDTAKLCDKRSIAAGDVPQHPFFEIWQDYLLQLEVTSRKFLLRYLGGLVEYARHHLLRKLRASRKFSFDDLLYALDDALKGASGERLAAVIRQRFPAALIDEFQDTDPVQYRIFRAVYGGRSGVTLFMIGDPKQAIYAFRGADIYAYLSASDHAGENVYTMPVNWRSGPSLVAAVNTLFGGRNPFYEERIVYNPVNARQGAEDSWASDDLHDAPLQFVCIPPEMAGGADTTLPSGWLDENVPAITAAEIVRLLAGDALIGGISVRPGDIAVLVKTNDQAARIQDALRANRIASVLQSRASVYESREAEALLRVLFAVAEPANGGAVRAALGSTLFGYTAGDILSLEKDDARWQDILDSFLVWNVLWHERGLMPMARVLMDDFGVAERLLRFRDGERRMTNLRHLLELLHARAHEEALGPSALLGWFDERCREPHGADEAELRLESDADAVQLVTIHKSKGLEFPVVFCPYLWEGRVETKNFQFHGFHDPQDAWQGRIALAESAQSEERRREELFAESLRLLYVALTRAKDCCMVLWGPARRYNESALAYLLHSNSEINAPERLDEVLRELRAMSPADLFDDLVRRVNITGSWTMRTVQPVGATLPVEQVELPVLANRSAVKAIRDDWRVGSFSRLVERPDALPVSSGDEGRDVADEDSSLPYVVESGVEVPLADFPKGAAAGNFFHSVLERIDFNGMENDECRAVIEHELSAYGMPPRLLKPVRQALADIVATPLHTETALKLRNIRSDERLTEMPFLFPVASDDETARFTSERLAAIFHSFPDRLPLQYPDEISSLNFSPMRGFMRGFADLVFRHEGRWYVADYKSNHLGSFYGNYNEETVVRAMREHHYYLQYHIYTVAVDRYLSWRVSGYDYDRDFGGVFYLFLRGMTATRPGHAVFFDRPPRERIAALSSLFADLSMHLEEIP